MTKHKLNFILMLFLFSLFTSSAFSQIDLRVKRTVATVIFSSLGGAILGLSTLPFYGEPQEHANNITAGALLGFIAGVGYVTLDSPAPASLPRDYSQADLRPVRLGERQVMEASYPLQMKWVLNF